MPSSSFRISAEVVGDEKLDHEAFDACAGSAAVEFGQHVGLDPVQKLRRIDQQDHPALRIQIGDAADQAHLLRRHLRRRTDGVAPAPS